MDLISEFNKVAFFENLGPVFKEHGYEFMPLLNQFRRPTESGFTNIIITPTLYSDVIFFEVTFGSRSNFIERTIEPYIHGLKGFKEDRNTTINSYGKYHGNKHLRLKAKSVEELSASMQEIKHFFQQEGFQYLKRLEDINTLDRLFNAYPSKESELAFGHEGRNFRGITVATLCQNTRWNSINDTYLQAFERYNTPSIIVDNYLRLTAFLTNSGLN